MRALILEDDRDRRVAMLARVAERFPFVQIVFFEAAEEMIAHLATDPLDDVVLIAFDNDLTFLRGEGGELIDPGEGYEVAEWLASHRPPTCPVVVHTTNAPAGQRMMTALGEAGWDPIRIVPHNDLEWVDQIWFPAVRNAIVGAVGKYEPTPVVRDTSA